MTKKSSQSAGAKLRADLDKALARAAQDLGLVTLEFTELERRLVDTAAEMADWAAALKSQRDAELAGDARPTTLVRLSAEVRHCERTVHDTLERINFGVGPAKSAQHQRAARTRWEGHRPMKRPV
ncbi:hypothetical protein CRM90_28435 [Mycobacterium sp. ENV421]|uniref:hypothetical protein n=1 Tax=Mycobacterium sp. ENV421 TaxID=1213407 RepID=UPI000C9A5BD7|nr:hypothetical protein [Mycobacterium sp. ENV421]PND54343.1 hypothetical protein CRM90_28435 [Mycobacterium sp. ENV421]